MASAGARAYNGGLFQSSKKKNWNAVPVRSGTTGTLTTLIDSAETGMISIPMQISNLQQDQINTLLASPLKAN
jgi:hypothetical protein